MVLLSGGIDSATCLYLCKKKGYRNRALTVVYHRIASGELAAAKRIAAVAGVDEHRIVNIPELREAGDIEGKPHFPGLPKTYIPNRNMIFYSLAASYAEETGASYIVGGHNAGDAEVFTDTRPTFFSKLQETIRLASPILRERKVTILRPLQRMSKPEVVRRAARIGVPLDITWSCHEEGREPCRRCDGCSARTAAFRAAGIDDPLEAFYTQKKV